MAVFDLLHEPWIPVLWANGKVGRVGIEDSLRQAGRIRQIAASNPMDRLAILRFLLALLYWCKGGPPRHAPAALGDPFPPDWFHKLDENRDCFDLLGESKRFYQCAVSEKTERLSANYLIHEIPTGTNKWHFRHSTDEVNGLCPACCAMGLLRLPLFATSGGRGKPPGVNAKPPLYVVPLGASLAATLRLSWRPASNLGTPAWEKPDLQLPRTGEVPLLVGLTWLPRRVWLDSPQEPETACISCGRMGRLVRLCVFAGIGSTRTGEGGPGRSWRDPHVMYSRTRQGDTASLHASDALGARDAAAGQWATIMAAMCGGQESVNAAQQVISGPQAENAKVHAWVVGFSTVQNDKYVEAMERLLPFPGSPELRTESLERIERWQEQARRMEKRIGMSKINSAAALAAVRPVVEGKVSAHMEELLGGADAAWERAADEYRSMMRAIGRSLSPGFTTAVLERRRQIGHIVPDVRPRSRASGEPDRKKRGNR